MKEGWKGRIPHSVLVGERGTLEMSQVLSQRDTMSVPVEKS